MTDTRYDDPRGVAASDEWSPFPTDEEIALGRALAAADAAERMADDIVWRDDYVDDDAELESWMSDDDLVDALCGPASETDLWLLASIDPRNLSHELTRVKYLQALDRVAGLVAAMRAETIVALVGDSSTEAYASDMHLEHEIAVARRTSRYSAGRAIENARVLATTFPAFREALRAGEVSESHCSVLVDRTRVVADPDALARIEARVLPKAKRLTPGEFGREVAKAVAALDTDAASRVEKARATRSVWTRQLDDGLGYLGMIHEWSTIKAIHEAVTADALEMRLARRDASKAAAITGSDDVAPAAGATTGPVDDTTTASAVTGSDDVAPAAGATTGPVNGTMTTAATGGAASDSTSGDEPLDADPFWEDSSLGACRADAMAARILGTIADDGTVTWDRSDVEVVVNLVMDLDTLRGEADRVAELDGQPIPGATARQAAQWARAWRRFVTDPVEGHLLDYGAKTYLPPKLRDFVLARDGECRTPGCSNRAASRLQMDHALEFPAGSSTAANCGGLCTSCHQLKTARLVSITDSQADGSATWTTTWGQVVQIPPRPVLDHAADRPLAETPTRIREPGPGDTGPRDIPPF